MRATRFVGGLALVAAVVIGGSALPAAAGGMPGLPWRSPAIVQNGVPVDLSSIAPCPAVPTPGDTVLVQVTLSFGAAGAEGQILSANADGSWSGPLTFFFSGVNLRQTTISAECLDFDGVSAVPYAQYLTRHTQIFD